jgi:phenylpropionate dioxygenase-like ring-hydroxylating dioxygenase large terminal subunit
VGDTAAVVTQADPGPGWFPVAASAEIGTAPVRVVAGGHAFTAFRADPDADVSVIADRCPHRLARLSHGTVVDGKVQCPYHGWRFDGAGRCVLIPSAGPAAPVPPRADLNRDFERPWGVREQGGTVWLAPLPPGGDRAPDERGGQELFTNLDPSLAQAWHPVALEPAVGADPVAVRLIGRDWTLRRDGGRIVAEPEPAGLQCRYGLVWIAPEPPRVELIDIAEDADPLFAGAWLEPARTASPCGVMAENFLDVAHFPFVHAATFGAAEEPYVEPYDVVPDGVESGGLGFRSVQEQWFDNPEDPGVAAGLREVRQRRRASYRYRAPFQLLLRLEELDAGAVKTIAFFLQPEDAGSTRLWTKLLVHGVGGVAVPPAEVLAAEVAFEAAVLAEDLALQRAMTVTGLPLRLRDELHVRSDRSGIELRRVLRRWQQAPDQL